jgi:hypothetical protein
MGTYNASLRAMGDTKPVPATLLLEDGQLAINSGDVEIGTWSLSDISLEPIPTGYRMAAEGEQIIIEIKELDAFRDALANGRFKRRSARLRGASERSKSGKAVETTATTTTTTEKPARTQGFTQKGLALIDGTLDKANKKWGSYLPDWMFTRAMFIIVFGALLIMLVFPGAVSLFLLLSGAVLIIFGAIAYSDTMLASRWLPGRTTPSHVLLFGVAILMMGVLLGVIAN